MRIIYILLFSLLLFGCTTEETVSSSLPSPPLTTWEPIKYDHIDMYFNKLKPEVRNSCKNHFENKVWAHDDMFEMKHFMVTDVRTSVDYQWYHEGDYLHVDFYCVFDVNYMINAFTYDYETIKHYVNGFRMKKYYNKETKKLNALNFE